MRLREIKSMFKKYQDDISIKHSEIPNSSDKFVLNLQKSINRIEELSALGFLDSDLKRLKSLGNEIYYSRNAEDKIRVDSKTFQNIRHHIDIINEKISGFQTLIDKSIPENRENVVNIKLPNYQEIDKLADFYKKLDFALRTGLKITEINGFYKLQNFDSGSFWTEIVLNNKESIMFFATLINIAIGIRKNTSETKVAKKKLEQLELNTPDSNDFMNEILEKLDTEIYRKIDEKVDNIKLNNKEMEPESKANLRKSIKTISDLLDEGTEFYPSLEESDEVKESFPTQPEQLNKPQDLLEENTQEETD